jgi:hypothetical protein
MNADPKVLAFVIVDGEESCTGVECLTAIFVLCVSANLRGLRVKNTLRKDLDSRKCRFVDSLRSLGMTMGLRSLGMTTGTLARSE